jgi:hypothetical protein
MSIRKLAPASMMDGYAKLTKLADELVSGTIYVEQGMYWLLIWRDQPGYCLGHNDDYAEGKLREIAAYWHARWQERADEIWEQETGDWNHQQEWEAWWNEVRGTKGGHDNG